VNVDNVTLGFGRTIGGRYSVKVGDELTQWEWGEFRHELRSVAEECGGSVHFDGTGCGTWEGKEEEAGCLAFFADDRFAWLPFRTALHTLCIRYQQDAIAVTAAESELYS
jgi:hypothetical protein